MSIDPDRYQVYAAIAGEGDWNLAVEALHRLTLDTGDRSRLAVKLMALRLGAGTDPGAMLNHGGAQAAQLERLLLLADQNPPRDPGWPRMRTMARLTILVAAVSGDSHLPPAQALAELEELAVSAADDPMMAKLIDVARRMLSDTVASDEGDASMPNRLVEDAAAFRDILPGNAEAALLADLFAAVADVQRVQQTGGDPRPGMMKIQQIVAQLPPEHPIRKGLQESMAAMGPMAAMLNDVSGDTAQSGPDDFAAAEELAARTDAAPSIRAVRHAAAGGLALRAWEETGVDRVSAGVEHFRTAVELTPDSSSERVLHLGGYAMALIRRNELTNSMGDLEIAAEALTEARTLAGGPRHPQWSYINDMFTRIQRRRGDTEAGQGALDSLRGTAWQVLLQDGIGAAKYAAHDAAQSAADAARMCLLEGRLSDAVQALDGGRGLMLFAATEFQDVAPRLREAGRPDLAERWSLATAEGAPELMPASLRGEVLAALDQDSSRLDPPSIAEIRYALHDLDADALVYLLPAGHGHPGWAVLVPARGQLASLGLANLQIDSETDAERYMKSLESRDLQPQSPAADLTASLDTLCGWAWRVAMGPIIEQFLPTLPAPESGRPHRLVLVPMGELALIPWQAARDREGRYALEYAAFSQAASARMLCRSADAGPVRTLPVGLVVGDPDTGGEAPELPAARLEAFAVHRTFYPNGRYVGKRPDGKTSPAGAGTAREVRDWLGATHPGAVLHLACHGVIDTTGDEATSYLMLADKSKVTAQEIIELMAHAPDAGIGLAVLAACRTGRSIHGYDEAYSLGTAFLAGGVRSVLSTLWAVPDEDTSMLMFMFHHYLRTETPAPWEALHRAQLWMLDPDRQLPESMPAPLRNRFKAERAPEIEAWAGFVHWGM
ncbi:CHAT domain-containing protein [Catenulispora rubra]|uniref:CHAT domain-containing protein n=1 Tax=Catenulispora rubra TaxID=280293 RepID=UPI0018925CF9|nr:CHAT domain-containing protein [Catenulispora rubra]